MSPVFEVVSLTLVKAAPLMLAAFGGLVCELSGLINFAIEGMMLSGAFAAVLGTWATGSPWAGLCCGVLAGMAAALVHATASLTFRANQIVSSIGVNLLAAGLTGLLLNQVFGVYGTSPGVAKLPDLSDFLPENSALSVRGIFEGVSILVPVAIVPALGMPAFLKWTVAGLRLKACGENPEAAEAVGLAVRRTRLQEQVRREEQSALEAAATETPESGASSGETSADVPADVGIENQFKASVAEYFKSVVNQYFDQMQRGAPPGAGAPPPPAPALPTTIR